MKFNTKVRYAIRTMIEIAMHPRGLYQKEIAKQQQLSIKYLDQIIPALKAAGLITNVRGKKSGYIITKDPAEITTYDVLQAFEPEVAVVDCVEMNFECKRERHCIAKEFWEGLNEQVSEYFKSYTLAYLAERQQELNKNVNHSTEEK